jgi:hypothetical protein
LASKLGPQWRGSEVEDEAAELGLFPWGLDLEQEE